MTADPAETIAPESHRRRDVMVYGANHRSSQAGLKDRLVLDQGDTLRLLGALRDHGLDQAVVLSTCDRLEVQLAHAQPAGVKDAVRACFADAVGLSPAALDAQTYCLVGDTAIRHVFAVAASLDSLVVGEPQVLGQVKEAEAQAAAAGMMGRDLSAVLQAAYRAAKRVRAETTIGERPVSMAAVAAAVARDIHGALDRVRALLLGGGEMVDLIVAKLRSEGLDDMVVSHRTTGRAEAIARRLGCHFEPLDQLDPLLAASDIVVSSVGTGRYAIAAEAMEQALRRRRRQPVYLIDAGVPRDIEPAVQDLDGAFVYDLDDLERLAMVGRTERLAAAHHAWELVEETFAGFMRDTAERAATPALTALRRHVEGLREAALADANGDADRATRLLVNRLLHDPSVALRNVAADNDANELEAMVRRLFGLDDAIGPGDTDRTK